MDGERSDGGEAEVEDEFACAGVLRGSLASLHSTVERIFRVRFKIGESDSSQDNNGQIWLNLQGRRDDVTAAKLFVRGVVNQEEQKEVPYPGVLHCVFDGARGLFMDCLIRSTSAQIVVGSPGFLLISGLEEPVVQAYSLIMDLVERYDSTQSRRSEIGDRGVGESLDSRRAFKTLVEKWEDRHILDLLVLPGSVKEILLDLVKDSGLSSNQSLAVQARFPGAGSLGNSEGKWDTKMDRWVEGTSIGLQKDSRTKESFTRGRAEGAEERLSHSPQEVGEEEQIEQVINAGTLLNDGLQGEEEMEMKLSPRDKEFWLLLKFFTAMGYTEDVVKRVLAQTGPKEASQILDLVQQEQDRSDREKTVQSQVTEDQENLQERNRPCETEHREVEEPSAGENSPPGSKGRTGNGTGTAERTRHSDREESAMEEEDPEEDFVLGVLKKAAASCGYMEQNVAKLYNKLPDGSTHQLLLELQKEESRELASLREGPREMDDVVPERQVPQVQPEGAEKREFNGRGWVELRELTVQEKDFLSQFEKSKQNPRSQYTSQLKQHQPTKSQTQIVLPDVKGPPMPTYSNSLETPLTNFQNNKQFRQTNYRPNSTIPKQNHTNHDNILNPKSQPSASLKRAPQVHQPSTFPRTDQSPNRARDGRGFVTPSSVVVTGEQRFLEGLQSSFNLQLTDKPGDPNLRTIIIDASNVAMSHGLSIFFSCRGIALAVQHFWDRGHRHISALLPQWRLKNDPKIKEKHYLTELQNLGLVSLTPSREVQGKRISSYDDRLMLQLAQKTNGVIVTNDNLRDLSDESQAWRDIIKKRLLQYTFVGDLFMVPDDPLGRDGPHLDDFLRSDHKTPNPGSHSFAGVTTTFPPFQPSRSQTELLNYRDRTPGGAADATRGGSRGRGRGRGQFGPQGPELVYRADRGLEETAALREQLCQVFPDQDNMVALVLQSHSAETDINVLSDLILQQQMD